MSLAIDRSLRTRRERDSGQLNSSDKGADDDLWSVFAECHDGVKSKVFILIGDECGEMVIRLKACLA